MSGVAGRGQRARRSARVRVAQALGALTLAVLAAGLLTRQRPAPNGAPRASRERPEVIDVHVHVSPRGVPRLLDLMRRHGVRHAVNLSGDHPLTGLEEQLRAARRSGGKLTVFTTLAYEQARFSDYGERMAEL